MSYLYEMGLRDARCNGCSYLELKWKLGDKFLVLNDGWINVYKLDAKPSLGQGEPMEHEGRPIRHWSSFMSIEHSDECWGYRIPAHPYVKYDPETMWKTREGDIIPISELEDSHLINILKLMKKGWSRHSSLDVLRKEAQTRMVVLTSGEEITIYQFVFPRKSMIQRIKELFE